MTEIKEKSELQVLLEKNSTLGTWLFPYEETQAFELIEIAEDTEEVCWLCKNNKAIYDTGLCKTHARYALMTRK
jgi:hypothetical protein